MDSARVVAMVAGAVVVAGCWPVTYHLPAERQADTNAQYRTATFTVLPPAGRWTVDTIPADMFTRGWPPRMVLDPAARSCVPRFDDAMCLVDPLVARPLPGYVFCHAPGTQLAIDERPDSLAACVMLRAFTLASEYRGAEGHRAALAALRERASALTEAYYTPRSTFGEAMRMRSHGPRRGAIEDLAIGAHTFHRLIAVEQSDSTRLSRGALDEQLVVLFLPDELVLVALSFEASWLSPGNPEWRMVESLRLERVGQLARDRLLRYLRARAGQ